MTTCPRCAKGQHDMCTKRDCDCAASDHGPGHTTSGQPTLPPLPLRPDEIRLLPHVLIERPGEWQPIGRIELQTRPTADGALGVYARFVTDAEIDVA